MEQGLKFVMPGLRPGHPRLMATARKTWMAGTKPGHNEKSAKSVMT